MQSAVRSEIEAMDLIQRVNFFVASLISLHGLDWFEVSLINVCISVHVLDPTIDSGYSWKVSPLTEFRSRTIWAITIPASKSTTTTSNICTGLLCKNFTTLSRALKQEKQRGKANYNTDQMPIETTCNVKRNHLDRRKHRQSNEPIEFLSIIRT